MPTAPTGRDRAAGAPQAKGSGSGRQLFGMPLWMVGGGVGIVVVILYLRRRSAAGNAGAASGALTGGATPVIDSATGGLIDPNTGLPYISSQTSSASGTQTLSGWITAAQAALKNSGYSPALIEQALYDFTNGNTLTTQEAGAINAALGQVGSPPNLLPFLGNIPNPHPPAPVPVPKPVPKPVTKVPLAAAPSIKMQPGEHIVNQVSADAKGGGYYLTNLGGVYAVGGAPFEGSFLGLPAKTKAGIGQFVRILLNPGGGYTEVTAAGQKYTFTPQTAKQHIGGAP